jgi:hypothetical protein
VDQERQTVVAVYAALEPARAAVDALRGRGIPAEQISFVARTLQERPELREQINLGDKTEVDAAKGAGLGGLAGLLAGAALAAIPGIGPLLLLGPLAAGLTGAVVGGLIGAMTGWGVPREQAARYEDEVRRGNYLVIVRGDPEQVHRAEEALEATRAQSVRRHAESSDDSPEIYQEPRELSKRTT